MTPVLSRGRSLIAWCVLLSIPILFFIVMARAGDRDETLFETPEGQTEYRLRALGERAEAYVDSSGHPPSQIEELLQPTDPSQFRDAWGRSIRYKAMAGEFELRSPGRDGMFGDHDDIVVRGPTGSRDRSGSGPATP